MGNYYGGERGVSAGSWSDCFSSSFISASRFLCERKAWAKSNQLNFNFSVTLAALFHPLPSSSHFRPYPRIFPSAPPDSFNALKTRFENFFLSKFSDPIRAEISAFHRNEGGEKKYNIGIEVELDEFQIPRVIKLLLLRNTGEHFFFLFLFGLGERETSLTFRGIGPINPGEIRTIARHRSLFLWSRLIRNCAISSRQIGSTLLISRSFETAFRHSTSGRILVDDPKRGEKRREKRRRLFRCFKRFSTKGRRFIKTAPPLITATNVTNHETARRISSRFSRVGTTRFLHVRYTFHLSRTCSNSDLVVEFICPGLLRNDSPPFHFAAVKNWNFCCFGEIFTVEGELFHPRFSLFLSLSQIHKLEVRYDLWKIFCDLILWIIFSI